MTPWPDWPRFSRGRWEPTIRAGCGSAPTKPADGPSATARRPDAVAGVTWRPAATGQRPPAIEPGFARRRARRLDPGQTPSGMPTLRVPEPERLIATCESVLVRYDYGSEAPVRISEAEIERIEAFEGRSLR